MPKPSRFWRALEAVAGRAAVPVVWKEKLGGDYAAASRYLRTTLHKAGSYPCPSPGGDGCPRRIVSHANDEIVAVCGDNPKRCESLRLHPQDAILWDVDVNTLAKDIVRGIAATEESLASTTVAGVWRIGAYTMSFDRHLPIYMLIRHGAEESRQAALDLMGSLDSSAIVLVPTQTWSDEVRPSLVRSKSVLLAMEDILFHADGGGFEMCGNLRQLIGDHAPIDVPVKVGTYAFRKEGEKWSLAFGGDRFFLDDAVGLKYISQLLATPGKEFSVSELDKACGSGRAPVRLGSAGEEIDAEAIDDYRNEKQDLLEELEDARRNGDLGRENATKDKLDAINKELSRGVGLGGRQRRALDDAERLRKRISMGIERALDKIKRQNQSMWLHLENSIQRGLTLAYRPDHPISWET
jgi:hypothetical protein